MSVKHILLALLVCVTLATVNSESLCGYVYDWGTEDVGEQYSTNYISASWAGFEQPNEDHKVKTQVRYEWAIISEDMASEAIKLAASEEDDSVRCRSSSGITATPDVADWTAVDATYASNYQLSLTPGQTYYVLLKVITTTTSSNGDVSETVTFSNGAGITISTSTKYTRGDYGKNKNNKNNNNKNKNNKNNKNKNGKNKGKSPFEFPSFLQSSFDTSNFDNVDSTQFLNSSDFSSFFSASSGLLGWQIALIVIACVFALILLLVLIFIVVGRSKGEDKYETNVHRNENVEKI